MQCDSDVAGAIQAANSIGVLLAPVRIAAGAACVGEQRCPLGASDLIARSVGAGGQSVISAKDVLQPCDVVVLDGGAPGPAGHTRVARGSLRDPNPPIAVSVTSSTTHATEDSHCDTSTSDSNPQAPAGGGGSLLASTSAFTAAVPSSSASSTRVGDANSTTDSVAMLRLSEGPASGSGPSSSGSGSSSSSSSSTCPPVKVSAASAGVTVVQGPEPGPQAHSVVTARGPRITLLTSAAACTSGSLSGAAGAAGPVAAVGAGRMSIGGPNRGVGACGNASVTSPPTLPVVLSTQNLQLQASTPRHAPRYSTISAPTQPATSKHAGKSVRHRAGRVLRVSTSSKGVGAPAGTPGSHVGPQVGPGGRRVAIKARRDGAPQGSASGHGGSLTASGGAACGGLASSSSQFYLMAQVPMSEVPSPKTPQTPRTPLSPRPPGGPLAAANTPGAVPTRQVSTTGLTLGSSGPSRPSLAHLREPGRAKVLRGGQRRDDNLRDGTDENPQVPTGAGGHRGLPVPAGPGVTSHFQYYDRDAACLGTASPDGSLCGWPTSKGAASPATVGRGPVCTPAPTLGRQGAGAQGRGGDSDASEQGTPSPLLTLGNGLSPRRATNTL